MRQLARPVTAQFGEEARDSGAVGPEKTRGNYQATDYYSGGQFTNPRQQSTGKLMVFKAKWGNSPAHGHSTELKCLVMSFNINNAES